MKKPKCNAAETPASSQRFKVAVVQAAPVVFDRERILEKVDALARSRISLSFTWMRALNSP
jgi:hypothetical protein